MQTVRAADTNEVDKLIFRESDNDRKVSYAALMLPATILTRHDLIKMNTYLYLNVIHIVILTPFCQIAIKTNSSEGLAAPESGKLKFTCVKYTVPEA